MVVRCTDSKAKRSRATRGLKDLDDVEMAERKRLVQTDGIVRLDKEKDIGEWQRLSQSICTLTRERWGESNSGYWWLQISIQSQSEGSLGKTNLI